MKQLKLLLAMLLVAALITSLVGISSAEDTKEEWQADILKLMKPENAPRSTSIHYDLKLPEGVHALYFIIRSDASVDFRSFEIR